MRDKALRERIEERHRKRELEERLGVAVSPKVTIGTTGQIAAIELLARILSTLDIPAGVFGPAGQEGKDAEHE